MLCYYNFVAFPCSADGSAPAVRMLGPWKVLRKCAFLNPTHVNVKATEAVTAFMKTLAVLALNDFLVSLPELNDFAKVSRVQCLPARVCLCLHCLALPRYEACGRVSWHVGPSVSLMFPIVVLLVGKSSGVCAWWPRGDHGARVRTQCQQCCD